MGEDLDKIAGAAGGRLSRPLGDDLLAEVISKIRKTEIYPKFEKRAFKDTPDHRPDEDDLKLFDELRQLCKSLLHDDSELVFLQVLTALRRECLTRL